MRAMADDVDCQNCQNELTKFMQYAKGTFCLPSAPNVQPYDSSSDPHPVARQFRETSGKEFDQMPRRSKRARTTGVDFTRRPTRTLLSSSTPNTTTPPPSTATTKKRRCRGPGKAKKAPGPVFNEPGFASLDESIRSAVFSFKTHEAVLDCKVLVEAFGTEVPVRAALNPADSRVKQLHTCLEHCNALEAAGNCMRTRAAVEWRFYLVELIAEYRRAKAKTKGSRCDESFRKELYPKKEANQAKSAWDYDYRVGEVLLQAVERYGYGVLMFPLHRLTKKRLEIAINCYSS